MTRHEKIAHIIQPEAFENDDGSHVAYMWIQSAFAKATAIEALLAEDGVPDGYALVPIESSEAMIVAAVETPGMKTVNAILQISQMRGYAFPADAVPDGISPLHQAWHAMLAAAPPIAAAQPTEKKE